MKFFRYIYILIAASFAAFTSCEDEIPYDNGDYGQGTCNLSATVEFHNLEPLTLSRAAGNAVDRVEKLWMVMYTIKEDGTSEFYQKILASDLPDYDIDQKGNTAYPDDAETAPSDQDPDSNIGPSEEVQKTPHATFTPGNIPFGRYRMYAVANIDLTDAQCATEEDLLNLKPEWNTNVPEDNAMFGYFTLSTAPTSEGFQSAQPLTINRTDIKLHAWLKRLVSKVTVSFDPSDLLENVRVYVKSVTIYDIPRYCPLGKGNVPTTLSTDSMIHVGESFNYTNGFPDNVDHEKWGIILSKGSGPKGEVNHTNTDKALYFFENLQGNFQGQKDYYKPQIYDPDGDKDNVGEAIDEAGTLDDGTPNDFKDRRPYGTYIEVDAYYKSRAKDKISEGPIKYRFMLGKNTTYNYNAERNYHYELTLKFRGYANEADWHISYKEYTPTLLTPEPYYISYLYGQKMEYPARLKTGDASVQDYTIKAEIVENNWWPWDREANSKKGARPAQFEPALGTGNAGMKARNGFAWNVPAFEDVYSYVPYKEEDYTPDFPYGGSNYVGFLSLMPVTSTSIGDDYKWNGSSDSNGYGTLADNWLKNYYNVLHKDIAVKEYSLRGDGATYDPIDKSVNLLIPMWTREKQMINKTDFTGNNPFYAYSRYAKVRITLWKDGIQQPFKNGNDEWETERISTIYQVPRIDNPKAIYRDWNKTDEFEVTLMQSTQPDANGNFEYKPFDSDGPWRASILAQSDNFISITANGKTVTTTNDYIYGNTDRPITFTYQPISALTSWNQTRCGIIKVEYHDYNCIHLIFVRQGYHKDVTLGGAKWSCYNVYSALGDPDSSDTNETQGNLDSATVVLTKSPLSVGSFYKRNQYNYGLLERNNETYGWLTSVGNLSTTHLNADGTVADPRNSTWASIQGAGWGARTQAWATKWTAKSGDYDNDIEFAVPTYTHFENVRDNCQFGFGIAYADGSSKVATTLAGATGFRDFNNDGKDDQQVEGQDRGMRVCVIYENSTGNNVLFPLGFTGHGQRSQNAPYAGPTREPYWTPQSPYYNTSLGSGVLSYGGMASILGGTGNMHRPLTYNLYRMSGALYWMNAPKIVNNNRDNSYGAWDINYDTVRFNPHDYGSIGGTFTNSTNTTDAMPIKLIYY